MAENNKTRFTSLVDETLESVSWLDAATQFMEGNRFLEHVSSVLEAGPGLMDVSDERKLPEVDAEHEDEATNEDGDEDGTSSSGDDFDREGDANSLDQDAFVQYLNGLHPQIVRLSPTERRLTLASLTISIQVAKHLPQATGPIPGLREEVQPYPHQQHATSFCLHALESKFKGVIIADPPGLGKTLPALMAIAASRRLGDGPCVVVAPVSCCAQWMREIKRFFSEVMMQSMYDHNYTSAY